MSKLFSLLVIHGQFISNPVWRCPVFVFQFVVNKMIDSDARTLLLLTKSTGEKLIVNIYTFPLVHLISSWLIVNWSLSYISHHDILATVSVYI